MTCSTRGACADSVTGLDMGDGFTEETSLSRERVYLGMRNMIQDRGVRIRHLGTSDNLIQLGAS